MPSTTNFGWTTPADTDLVKDGASAIRTLGNGIDTSLVDLKGGTTGQVLSKNSNTDLDFTWVAQDDSNAIQNALLTTTGDTIYASGASTPARLGIGTTGQVLTVSGGVPSWATPAAGGGFTQIATGSLGSTATTISSISQSYRHLYLRVVSAQLVTTGDLPAFRLNGNTSAVYANLRCLFDSTVWNASAALSFIRPSGANIPITSNTRVMTLFIENYTSTEFHPITTRIASDQSSGDTSAINFANYNSTTAITSITITTQNGTSTFSAGTYYLFGVN